MKKEEEADGGGCRCCGEGHRCCKTSVLVLLLVAGAVAWYMTRDESKKRYIKHLARQVPYLPARYYA
ncbi:MAG: hypothetical protein V1748_05885 [Actinomycetota bacterium]